ncbi:MAG: RNA polymerase sigma factor [Hydrogenophaga sp.]|uniref:RNA polymerase sigma factor n=1 Tax=Hydrogenophaga sp. TaxID=1904254 RepID=UPI0025C64FD0|nr:RNA polymerase sigma factor [Hydrogenophaga sp.]MBT9552823.1 RNA polymerase sigma factor [Hydrogenophaga sp.]
MESNTAPQIEVDAEPVLGIDSMAAVPALMVRIKNREQAAMAELYVLCHAKVFRHVAYLIRDDQAARDITQDVFLRIWRYASAYDPAKSFNAMAWINQVARNQVLTELARRKRRQEDSDEILEDFADEGNEREQLARMTARSPAFTAAMGSLSASSRRVITMRFFAEQSLAEIASELDVPLGTVKTWLHRGLARMKAALETGNMESQKS